MNEIEKRAIEYIKNAGGNPEVAWFDEDHEPIGAMLRNQLSKAGLIKIVNDKIELVPEITWTNCAEQMPPDDENVIYRSLLTPHPYPCKGSIMKMFILGDPNGYLAQEWTPYSEEKLEALNK